MKIKRTYLTKDYEPFYLEQLKKHPGILMESAFKLKGNKLQIPFQRGSKYNRSLNG